MKRTLMFITLAALLVLAGAVLAMSSDSYRLDWFTPLSGSGGGPAGSTHYAANLTIGQAATGVSASANYQVCLGYRCGGAGSWRIYLPLVVRASA